MALIGIASGYYIMMNNGMDYIHQILANPQEYLPQTLGVLWGVAVVYAFLFQRVYHINSKKVNWWGTLMSSFSHLLIIFCAAAVTCAVLWAAGADLSDKFDRYARNQKTQDTLPELEQ